MHQPKYNPMRVEKSQIINLEMGKLPPQAIEFEEAILGAVLIDKKGLEDLFQVITSSDVFYKDAHKYIFDAIKRLSDANSPVDLLTVDNQLKINKTHDLAGGSFYLLELTQKASSSAHVDFWAHVVLQKYITRKVISMCSECIEAAYDPDIDAFALMDRLDADVMGITEMLAKGKSEMTYAEALDTVVDKVKMLTDADETMLTGVPTGFVKLNKHFGGWQKSDFIVIGARPGMGKTAFTLRTTVEAAKAGFPVGFISLEMSTEQLVTRTVAVESNYHLKQLTKTGFEKTEYFGGLLRKVKEMRDLPIHIDDRPALTIGEIKRKARLYVRKYKIKLLIVDYLQLAGSEKNEDIRIRVGKISNGLKALAKELDIPVIALAQLSREVEKAPAKRPSLHHLKESGDIEQDADAVCFLYRPGYYGFDVDTTVIDEQYNTEYIVAKYRHGGLGTYGLYFDENKTKFLDEADTRPVDENGVIMEHGAEYRTELPKPTMTEAFGNSNIIDQSDTPF